MYTFCVCIVFTMRAIVCFARVFISYAKTPEITPSKQPRDLCGILLSTLRTRKTNDYAIATHVTRDRVCPKSLRLGAYTSREIDGLGTEPRRGLEWLNVTQTSRRDYFLLRFLQCPLYNIILTRFRYPTQLLFLLVFIPV